MNQVPYENHFVICGWKDRMNEFFKKIISSYPVGILNRVIVVANIEANEVELFKQNYPEFNDLFIIRGNHYSETLLRKACVDKARKIVILADERNDDSIIGTDSSTFLTAMTIRSISATVTITAELADVTFEKYLFNADVDEIVYSNEYSSALLASSLQHIGIAKTINDLLVSHISGRLLIVPIPDKLYQKTFKNLQDYFVKENGSMVIGVLENVGNLLDRKSEAIRLAQKTASVSDLVENLKAAKNIENNKSYILPEDNFIISNNTMAILIKKNVTS